MWLIGELHFHLVEIQESVFNFQLSSWSRVTGRNSAKMSSSKRVMIINSCNKPGKALSCRVVCCVILSHWIFCS